MKLIDHERLGHGRNGDGISVSTGGGLERGRCIGRWRQKSDRWPTGRQWRHDKEEKRLHEQGSQNQRNENDSGCRDDGLYRSHQLRRPIAVA